ncbi:MAG: glycosyltransferase [Alphaproteobacteria bacterium]|nr:glycosyltransferase [Alphaproteobacteria bacterium]
MTAHLAEGTPEHVCGVRHLPLSAADDANFFAAEDFDAIITVTAPALASYLRTMAPNALQIAWLHALPDQAAMQPLAGAAETIDCAVLVSEYQRRAVRFAGTSHVIGNGIAPAFENLFSSADELLAAKQNRAAYITTPFRGLAVLTKAFGQARLATELDVWSGMRVYQGDDAPFAELYEVARATPRLRLHQPIGQSALARCLKPVAFLFYPSIFFETYCISALEAIAAGLKVVTTDLGALRETTLGFADLVPAAGLSYAELIRSFAARMEATEAEFLADPRAWAEERFAQSREVVRRCNWQVRAREWEGFLAPAIAARRAGP